MLGKELTQDQEARDRLAGAEIEPLKVSGDDRYLHVKAVLGDHVNDLGGGLLHEDTWRAVKV